MSVWVAPSTALSGGGITAAYWNAEVRDHLNWLKAFADLITGSTAADTGTGIQLAVIRAASGDTAFASSVSGDSVVPFLITARGEHRWGPGGASGRNVLFGYGGVAGRLIIASADASNSPSILFELLAATTGSKNTIFGWRAGDTQPRMALGQDTNGDWQIAFGPGGSTAPYASLGLRIGAPIGGNDTVQLAITSDTVVGTRGFGIGRSLAGNPEILFSISIASAPTLDFITGAQLKSSGRKWIATNGRFAGEDGLVLKTKAGTISDADFFGGVGESGLMALDTTNSRIYVRVGSTWKFTAVA